MALRLALDSFRAPLTRRDRLAMWRAQRSAPSDHRSLRYLTRTDTAGGLRVPRLCPRASAASDPISSRSQVVHASADASSTSTAGGHGSAGARVDPSGYRHDCCHRSPAPSNEEVRGPDVPTAQPGAGQRHDGDCAEPNARPFWEVQIRDRGLESRGRHVPPVQMAVPRDAQLCMEWNPP
jgi:hypothetical protein